MKNKITALFLCLTIVCTVFISVPAFSASATDKDFTANYYQVTNTTETGFPIDTVSDLVSAPDGLLWFATGLGLICYNGSEYTVINKENVPESKMTTATKLFVDSKGRIWTGTNDIGIVCKDGNVYTVFDVNAGAPSNSVRDIDELADGTIVVATANGIYSIANDNTIKVYENQTGITVLAVMLAVDKINNNILCLTDTGAVYYVSNGIISGRNIATTITSEAISCVSYVDSHRFCFGTDSGEIISTDVENEVAVDAVGTIKTDIKDVDNVYNDNNGRLWILSKDAVGYIDEADTYHPVRNVNLQNFSAMAVDFQGNYWFTSQNKGVTELCPSKLEYINNAYSIGKGVTNCVIEVDGELYIGTEGGLQIVDTQLGQPVNNSLVSKLKGINVLSLETDNDGNLYIGTGSHGLYIYSKNGGIKNLTAQDGLTNDSVNVIESIDEYIAVGTDDGLTIIKNGKIDDKYNTDNGLAGSVRSIQDIPTNRMWLIGTLSNGAYRIKDYSLVSYNEMMKNVTGSVNCITQSNNHDAVWIGVGTKLYYSKAETELKEIKKLDLMRQIIDIFHSPDGGLWIVTPDEIIITTEENLLDDSTELSSKKISKNSGLFSNVNTGAKNFMSADGKLYLCCDIGVLVIDTQDFEKDTVKPQIILNGVSTGKEYLDITNETITIPGDTNRISFEFSILSFLPYENYTIRYKLDGQDEEYSSIDAESINKIAYTNLAGGKYKMIISVIDENGITLCSESYEVEQKFGQLAQRLFKAFTICLTVFLVALLGYLIIVIRSLRNKKNQKRYITITEQTMHAFAKAIDAKDEYTKGHSERVARYSVEIARRYGIRSERLRDIFYSALLHDIGKIGIPDEILNKPDKLSDDEFEIIKTHTTVGAEILSDMNEIKNIQFAARDHHEKYNGTGYPRGLVGNRISFEGRVVGAADAYDAMTTFRGYNETRGQDYIRNEIIEQSGQQFDPDIAKILVEMIDDGYFNKTSDEVKPNLD